MYIPGLNDQEKTILEQIVYRTSRSIYLQNEGLQAFFEATDSNKNGFLEKNEIEQGYKGQNDSIIKSLDQEIAANKSNKLASENLKHTLDIYKKCSESLNERVKELIAEAKLGNNVQISLDQLREFYEKTYLKALKCLGNKDALLKVVKVFQGYVDGFLKSTPDDVKNNCASQFGGCTTFEKILEKRKATTGNTLANQYFDLVYYYIFYVFEKPEEDLGSFFNKAFAGPADFFESLKYFAFIAKIAGDKVAAA